MSEPVSSPTLGPAAAAPSEPRESFVTVNGHRCRVWEKGDGAPLGFLPGLRGLPRWPPFLDLLATKRRVVALSPPGFPGSPEGHHDLDDLADFVTMTLDLLDATDLTGTDLVGASVGGMLAAEAAAFANEAVRKLVLIDSFGLYDEQAPPVLYFPNTPPQQDELLAHDQAALQAFAGAPPDLAQASALDWELQAFRVNEATARLVWPMGDHGLRKRLHRIRAATLVVWGAEDRLFPPSYARLFEQGIAGRTRVKIVKGAGHLAWLDRPEEVADAVLRFVGTRAPRRKRKAAETVMPSADGGVSMGT